MKRRFVLFSMPRTGSIMLALRLSEHPNVYCHRAVFSRRGWPSPLQDGLEAVLFGRVDQSWRDLDRRLAAPEEFISALERATDADVVGVKHHFSGPNEVTLKLLADRGRKIVLTRSNFLASYSSQKLVVVTGQGIAQQGDSLRAGVCFFDAAEFEIYRRRRERVYQRWLTEIDESQAPSLVIDYGAARTEAGVAAVLDFLGVAAAHGSWPTLKRHGDQILDRFENPDQVFAHLESIGRAEWAYEGDLPPPAVASAKAAAKSASDG
jgi:hypothetical protein